MDKKETYENIGKAIHIFNEIEEFINYIICHYVNPENKDFFLNYILNTSIINYGSKIKILINLNIFEKKEIEAIRKFSSFRNVFAHSNRTNYFKNNIDEKKRKIIIQIEDIIYKNNSDGKIIKENYKKFIKEHKNLQNEVINIISNHIIKYKINTEPYFHIENLTRFIEDKE